MRQVPITRWKEGPEGQEEERDIIYLLNIILKTPTAPGADALRGLDSFRIYTRLDAAFKKAAELDVLELDEGDWVYLKDLLDKKVPATWAFVPEAVTSIEGFMGADKVEIDTDKKKEK